MIHKFLNKPSYASDGSPICKYLLTLIDYPLVKKRDWSCLDIHVRTTDFLKKKSTNFSAPTSKGFPLMSSKAKFIIYRVLKSILTWFLLSISKNPLMWVILLNGSIRSWSLVKIFDCTMSMSPSLEISHLAILRSFRLLRPAFSASPLTAEIDIWFSLRSSRVKLFVNRASGARRRLGSNDIC